MTGKEHYGNRKLRKGTYRRRAVPVPGNTWADRFYYPMPTVKPEPADRMRAAWDALPDWCQKYAKSEQARTKGGKPPICPDCDGEVITYPFSAVESYQGVRHTWCRYPEKEARSAQAG